MAQSSEGVFYDGYGTHKYKAEINLWWTNDSATSATLHASGGGWLYNSDGWSGSSINIAGTTASGNCGGGPLDYYWAHSEWWWNDITVGTYTKTHSSQSISKSCSFNYGSHGAVTATAYATLGAKTSYTVTYSANGGSGAPGNQTKWHGENLTLSTTTPTKSGFAFKGWSGSNGSTYQAGSSYTGNANLTLTAIWQALTTDLDDVANTTIGQNPTFTWTPQSAGLTYLLKLSLGTYSWTSSSIAPGSTSKYTYNSYTLPMTICDELPTQTSGIMQVDLETYNGGTKTGTSTKYFNVAVPSSAVPTVNTAGTTLAEDNGLHVFLQNYTQVKGTLNCTRAYSSDIVEVKMTIGDDVKTVVPTQSTLDPTKFDAVLTSDVLTVSGSTDVVYTITDARGRTTTNTAAITVYEYEEPDATLSLSLEGSTVTATITPTFSSVNSLNSATYKVNDGTSHAATSGTAVTETFSVTYPESRNFTCEVVVTDAVTSTTVTKKLYPERGNRFETLDGDSFYIGMDDKGWKDVASQYDGGIREDGAIWFERTEGNGALGIGLPIELEPDKDYELIYSANETNDDTVALVSFFRETAATEAGFSYLSTTYDHNHLASGAIFHTPQIESGTLWGILVLGVDPISYEQTVIGYREFTNVVVRKIESSEEDLYWEVETGNLGLDTPNQKYISRVQMRINYSGSMNVGIAYENEGDYKSVYESVSDKLKSVTVPINVKRADHFRIRLSGQGQVHLYSMGYYTEDGSTRCSI